MWFSYPNTEDWIPLKVDRVKEIMAMNKRGQKPINLKEEAVELTPVAVAEKIPDYENVVGQDSLTRLDDKPRNKGNKNNRNNPNKTNENRNSGNRPEKGPRPPQHAKPVQGPKPPVQGARPEKGPKPTQGAKPVQNPKQGQQPKPANKPVVQAAEGTITEQPGAASGQPSANRNRNRNNNRRKKQKEKPKDE